MTNPDLEKVQEMYEISDKHEKPFSEIFEEIKIPVSRLQKTLVQAGFSSKYVEKNFRVYRLWNVRKKSKENLNTPNCVRTYSGQYVNILNPHPDTILIEDIAHGLSQIPRFGGQLPYFYSVAQHSIWCANHVKKENCLAALLHDASEAYLGDMTNPLKCNMPHYKLLEVKFNVLISKKFGITYPFVDNVRKADMFALELEWQHLFIEGKNWEVDRLHVESHFLDLFKLYSI